MRLVSPLLKRAVYPTLHRTGWLARTMPPDGYAVVNYHGVLPAGYHSNEPFLDGNLIPAETLRKQLRLLKKRYQILQPEDFRQCVEQRKPLPPRSILITCDDGLLNVLTDMLPVLQEEQVSCLFFVTAASCDEQPRTLWYEELYRLMRQQPLNDNALRPLPNHQPSLQSPQNFQAHWWDTVRRASQLNAEKRSEWIARVRAESPSLPSADEKRWRLLNLGELKQLSAAGMSIGAHTFTHPVLSLCTDHEATQEIKESKIAVEKTLGRQIWAFAYPYGNPATMGDREFELAGQAGYACAFLNVEHWRGRESNPFSIPRIHVTSDMSLPEFAAHVSGFHLRLQRAVGA
jgi:peptidoglycan/xylan/chitin deacetylase (PgdA/CDA1 family)